MGKASLTISIAGEYNAKALQKAKDDLRQMRIQAASEMGGVASHLVNAGAKAGELGGMLTNAGSKMESFGKSATKNITLPIVAAAAACGKAAVDIDTALTGVKKTVDGTDAQYQQLKESAIAFSKTNAVSASQILDLQALGAQLGYSIDELDMFSQVTSGLDIATDMSAEQAATELAQFSNITKMAHDDTERYASTIVNLGNHMATTESKISSMGQRVAAASSQVGMSESQILGWSAAMSSLGIEAEAGGTAFSTTIASIDAAVAKNSESLQNYASVAGMSADEFKASWKRSASETFVALLKGVAGADNMTVALSDLGITGIRQTDVMKRLAGNTDLVTQALGYANQGWTENKALQAEVENRNQSMAARLEILKNRVVAIAEKVGTPLVNALLEVVDTTEPLLEGIGDIAQGFADMDKGAQKFVLGLVAAVAAAGPMITASGKLVKGVGSVITTFGSLQQSIGAFVGQMKGGTSAMGAAASATGKLSGSMSGLSVAMGGIAVAALVAEIGMMASEISKAHEREEKLREATDGLREAHSSLNKEVVDTAEGLGSVSTEHATREFGEFVSAIDECIDSQAQLASDLKEKWSDVNTNAALVERYVSRIDELTHKFDENGNQAKLSSTDVADLTTCVKGLNDITGSTIEVIDAEKGVLSQTSAEIKKNSEAWVANAKSQAAQESLIEIQKQKLKSEMELARANKDLAASQDEYNRTTANLIWGDQYAADELATKSRKVDELQSAVDAASDEEEFYLGVIADTTQATKDSTAATEDSADAMDDAADSAESLSEEAQKVYEKLHEVVATHEDLRRVMADNNLSMETLATRMSDAGLEASDLAKSIDDFASKTQVAFDRIERKSDFSLDTMIANLNENNRLTQEWGADMQTLYSRLGGQGMDSFLQALKDKGPEYANVVHELAVATPERMQEVVDAWKTGASTATGAAIGEMQSKGVDFTGAGSANAQAYLAGTSEALTNDTTVASAMSGLIEGVDTDQLPDKANNSGKSVGPDMADGIDDQSDDVAAAADRISKLAADHFSSCTTDAWWAGHSMANDNYTAGVESGNDAVARAADSASKLTADHLSSHTTDSWWAGHNMVAVSYAQGIGSGADSASAQARSISKLTADHLSAHTSDAWWAGHNTVIGFSNGMGSVNMYNVGWNVGMSALNGIKAALGVASPSKETTYVGEMFGEGAIVGMRSKQTAIAQEVDRMGQAMTLTPAGLSGFNTATSPSGTQYVFNVSINVSSGEHNAGMLGETIASQLYTEFARRERQLA